VTCSGGEERLAVSFTKELDYVPFFPQLPGDFCGAANAQMARDGYPDPSNRRIIDQNTLLDTIHAHNSTTPPDPGKWNTDPQGLQECLQGVSKAPVDWVVCASPDFNEVMQFILKSMHRTGYPVPVIVKQGDHWVLIVGWETDVEPTPTNTPKLLRIHFFDPAEKGASNSHISARSWKSINHFSPIDRVGTWKGKYVAVGQGPL
jgi:hypothetical protein